MAVDKQIIYVVDDERVIAETLTIILSRAGFIAIPFENPNEALASARGIPPDFLISDVMMPEMNGIELGIQTRAVAPACSLLLFSGKAPAEDLLDAVRNRGLDFEVLSKPMHPVELLAKLHSAVLLKLRSGQRDGALPALASAGVSQA